MLAALLAAAYAYWFTDWFHSNTIQIIPTIRPRLPSGTARGETQVCPVSFSFPDKYRLTMLKVVHAAEYATNKYATPLWHLVTDSNSVPTKAVVYGVTPKGMKPAVARAHPETLQPELRYLLLVEAGKLRAQTNFFTREVIQPGGP